MKDPFFEEPGGDHRGSEAEESPNDLEKPGDGKHK
jgi:hypothetical protein